MLYEESPRDASIFAAPVIFLRYALWPYLFGSSTESGESNIILPFDFVCLKQFEIYLHNRGNDGVNLFLQ